MFGRLKLKRNSPLGMGSKCADHFSSSSQSPSLASGVDSRQQLFSLWKLRSLNRESPRHWAEAKEVSAYIGSIGKIFSSSSLPLSSSLFRRSWSLDSGGLLVENAVTGSLPSSMLSSTATGILQGDGGSGTSMRTRSRTPRTLKRPLASVRQRGDDNAAPRPLFSSTLVAMTESGRWRIRDVQTRLTSCRYEVAWKKSSGSCVAFSTLAGDQGNGH